MLEADDFKPIIGAKLIQQEAAAAQTEKRGKGTDKNVQPVIEIPEAQEVVKPTEEQKPKA